MATFDVAAIVKDAQKRFRLFATPDRDVAAAELNNADAEHLAGFLNALADVTDNVAAKRASLSNWIPDSAIRHWDRSFALWSDRLDAYIAAVNAAPSPQDRQSVLWTVTAPLLLGLFGGPDSTSQQRVADLATPFSLANQLDADAAWRDDTLELLWQDVKRGAADVVPVVATGVGVVAAVAAVALGAVAISRLRSKR